MNFLFRSLEKSPKSPSGNREAFLFQAHIGDAAVGSSTCSAEWENEQRESVMLYNSTLLSTPKERW